MLAIAYLFMQGVTPNLGTLFALLALLYSFIWALRKTLKGQQHSSWFWGFLVGSNLFMAWAHVYWFFDIGGAKTGSSTSALIFVVMPFWAFIIGGVCAVLYRAAKGS